MARHARLLGLVAAVIALGAVGAGSARAAGPVDALNDTPPGGTLPAVGPSTIDVLANDTPGTASESRPLTITAVTKPGHGAAYTDGRAVIYDPSGCYAGGNDSFQYTITDGVTSDTATVIFGVVRPPSAPRTDVPTVGFIPGSRMGGAMPLRVGWCGVVSTGASLVGYRVEQSSNGGSTFPTLISGKTTAMSTTRGAAIGTPYAWRVRTTDTDGTSTATSLVSRVLRYQESHASIAYSAGWKTATLGKASGDRERYVTRSGATATLTVSNVRQFAIVASTGSGRGSFHVYVDGKRVTSSAISQRTSKTAWRRVLYVGSVGGNTAGTHTIQVRTTSKARVDLDAIVTMSGKAVQTLAFGTPAPTDARYRGAAYDVTASSTAGLPVLLSVAQASWPTCSLADGTVTFHGAGTCTVTATQPGDPSTNARTATQSFAVARVPLTVTGVSAVDRIYAPGDRAATVDASLAQLVGVLAGDEAGVTLVTTGATGTFADANAGTGKTVQVAGLSLSGPKAALYSIVQPTTTADIAKADQVISYDTEDPVGAVKDGPTYAVAASATSGLQVAITVAAGSAGICSIAGNVVSFPGSGDCVLEADQPGDANWNPAVTAIQGFSVASTGTAVQTITFEPLTDRVYGDGPVALTASSDSGLPVTLSSETGSVCSVTGTTATILSAGTCTIEARQAGGPVYAPALPEHQSFEVDHKTLTVTGVTAANRAYDGTTAATLGFGGASLVGVVGADEVTLVTAGASGTFTPDGNVGVRTVAVAGLSLGGGKAGSYDLTQPTTTASITKATLTVTAEGKAITYGQADPAFTFTYAGFVNGEGAGVLDTVPTCSVAAPGRDVSGSPYAITCSGGADGNYAFSYVAGSLGVSPKGVTASFTAADRVYDATTAASITGCTLAGVVAGDTATCSSASATASFATAAAGADKTVTATGFTIAGGDAGNYTITGVNTTTADIAKAAPACTVTGYAVAWDNQPHTATGQCLGVVGETLAGLDLDSTTHTAVGTYTDDPWTFTDATGNYTNTAGVVTNVIGKAAQTISFTDPPDKTYGDAPFGLTATATSGLTVTFATQNPLVCTVSGSTVTLLRAGDCTILASQAGNATWAAAPTVDRTVAVSKATLTVTAANQAVDFDEPAPVYTFAYGGFKGSDDAGDITTPPTCGSAYDQGDDVGSYPINCSGGADDQYAFSYMGATLTVSKADQIVAFDGLTPTDATVGGSSTQTATASSGLPATVTVDASAATVCTKLGDTVTYLLPGTCLLNANQEGNGNWNAAPQVQRSFTVSLVAQAIQFDPLIDRPYGDTFAVVATATSNLTVAFASTTPGVCTVDGNDVAVVNTGTCTIRATQPGDGTTWAAAAPVDRSFSASTRPITVTAVTDNREADGTTASDGVPTVTAGNLAAGDLGTFSQVFNTATAGTGKTLTPSGTIANGATDVTGRYAITFQPVTTGEITPAALDSIVVTPSSSSITAGGSRAYTAEGFDAFGNSRGDVTADATFTIAPDGSCTDATCTATDDGPHTVTGTIGAIDDDASLTVDPAAATTLEVTATSPQAAGTPFAVTVTARDSFGNLATGYTGTVALTSTAPDLMPGDHAFTGGDAGTFAFTVTIAGAGSVTFTATDIETPSITGSGGAITVQ